MRINAPRARLANPVPTKWVATTFFNTFQTTAPNKEEPENYTKSRVLDTSMLDADFDKHIKSASTAWKKKRAFNQSVAYLPFDALPPQPNYESTVVDVIPFESGRPVQDHYDDPPPIYASAKPPIKPKEHNYAVQKREQNKAVTHHIPTRPTSISPKPVPVTLPPQMPPRSAGDWDRNVLMFWTDGHEMRVGGGEHLYLFVKVPLGSIHSNQFGSVRFQIEGMKRVLCALQRQTKLAPNGQSRDQSVKMTPEVYGEVSIIIIGNTTRKSTRLGAAAIRSGLNFPTEFKAKKVVRSCPFEDAYAPREPTDYLKVKMPYENINRLSPDHCGATFCCVYETRTSSTEKLCLKWKLRGPG
ncbi:hypothetical protein FGB62_301g03 [Gracilaria domingensis]|nr:hypothetical protein FGB62_301g03 [Gracilaria domingensis]